MPGPGSAPWRLSAITTSLGRSGGGPLTMGRPIITNASLRQVVLVVVFVEREVGFRREAAGRGRRVVAGPGVAWPKSRFSGCEPAALATEPFPGCPPGPVTLTVAAWLASAWRRPKMASLTCRLRERRASLGVLPSASFL